MELSEIKNLKQMIDFGYHEFADVNFIEYKTSVGVKAKTYRQLKEACESFGNMLFARGYKQAHVAIIGPTSFNWIVSYFGAANSGGVAIPLAPAETNEMNCRLMEFADTDILVFDNAHRELYELAKRTLPNIKYFISVDNQPCDESVERFSDIIEKYQGPNTFDPEPDSLCTIVFTSGTTGFPKGVMLSHKNLVYAAVSVHVACPTKRMFCCLPIHHGFCFTANITKSICRGKTVCVNDKLTNIVQDLRLFKPDSIIAVPQLVSKLMEGAIRYAASKPEMSQQDAVQEFLGGNIMDVISGGAPLDAALNERYNNTGILVLNGYGMTECSPVIANNAIGCFRHGSVGKPIPCMTVKIEKGEILVKGPNVMLGYYKNPEATKAAFTEDGFFRTGDLGRFDDDGYLYITGRCKNLILLSNGENVSAEMLEERFAAERLVQEVVCFGENGAIYAEVYPNKTYMAEHGITDINKAMPELLMRVNSKLAHYQKISGYIVRELPFERTSSSKIKRGDHGSVQKAPVVLPEDANQQRVYAAVCELLNLKEVSMTDNFFAIGGDSLSAVELALSLGVKPQTVYDKPFLSTLAQELEETGETEKDGVQNINEIIAETRGHGKKHKQYRCALLTGATGFLGVHILKELVDAGLKVYCLVRSKSRLAAQLDYYFEGFGSELIVPVSGNIEKERFGLSREEFSALAEEVDTVFHVAANVHHAGDYAELERTNVVGTRNVIDFCMKAGAVLQHTSTVSLHGAATVRQGRKNSTFDESVLNISQYYCDNVYIHSKYRAEEAVLLARKQGLSANIFRIGNLTWRASDGVFQRNSEDNGFLRRIHAILKLGLFHENMNKYPMDLTAVDECAEGFVKLALSGYENEIYHMYNQNYLDTRDLFRLLEVPYRTVSTNETIETAFANTEDRDIHVYLFYMIISGRSENIPMLNDFTLKRLSECGFKWSVPDKKYLTIDKNGGGGHCLDFDATILKPMRTTGGILNPIQKLTLGVLKEAKPEIGKVHSGDGSAMELLSEMKARGVKKPLVITLRHYDRLKGICDFMEGLEAEPVIFNSYEGEPTVSDSHRALELYLSGGCDCVVAIGGGSALDLGKVTALRAGNAQGDLEDICKLGAEVMPSVPLFAAPTTAGTGSEVTVYAVLTDEQEQKKRPFISDKFLPVAIALDPSLTRGLSEKVCAYGGIDALSHAVESYISLFADAFSEDKDYALKAARSIFENLEAACKDPNSDSRAAMLEAAFEAGIAFRCIGTGYIHAIAHRLGELYHAPHGLCIGTVFTAVLRAYLPFGSDRMAKLARYCGISQSTNDLEAANSFISAVDRLIEAVGIDRNQIRIHEADLDNIVLKSQEEAKLVGYPRPFSDGELRELLQ